MATETTRGEGATVLERTVLEETVLDETSSDPTATTETKPSPAASVVPIKSPHPPRTRFESVMVVAASCVGRALTGFGLTSRGHRLEVTRHEHHLDLGSHHTMDVAVLADLHLAGTPSGYARLIAELERAEPDLILYLGDTFETEQSYELVSLFAHLRPPLGSLAVLGNWEHAPTVDLAAIPDLLERAGIRLLVNETVQLGGLTVVGLDDARDGAPEIRLASEAAATGPTLTLSHCPIGFDEITAVTNERDENAPHLVLAGHTHGGQIAPFGRALYCPPGSGRYVKGWYHEPSASLYVSRGIGFSGARLRVGSRPELTLLRLR